MLLSRLTCHFLLLNNARPADENVQSMFYFVSDSNSGGEFEINGVNEKIPAS